MLNALKRLFFLSFPIAPLAFAVVDYVHFGMTVQFFGFLCAAFFALLFVRTEALKDQRIKLMEISLFATFALMPFAISDWGLIANLILIVGVSFGCGCLKRTKARALSALGAGIMVATPLFAPDTNLLHLGFYTIAYLNLVLFAEWTRTILTAQKVKNSEQTAILQAALEELEEQRKKLEHANIGYETALLELDVLNNDLEDRSQTSERAVADLSALNEKYAETIDKLEQAQKQSERAQQLATAYLEQTDAAITLRSLDGQILDFNEGAQELYAELSLKLQIGSVETFNDVHPDVAEVTFDRPFDTSDLQQVQGTRTATITWDNGTVRHFLFETSIIELGEDLIWLSSWHDITDAMEAEAELKAQTRKMELLGNELHFSRQLASAYMDLSSDPIFIRAENEALLEMNEAAEKLFTHAGLVPKVGTATRLRYGRKDRINVILSEGANGRPMPEQVDVFEEDGSVTHYIVNCNSVVLGAQNVTITTLYNVTEVLNVNEALSNAVKEVDNVNISLRKAQQEAARLNSILHKQSAATVAWAADTRKFVYANESFTDVMAVCCELQGTGKAGPLSSYKPSDISKALNHLQELFVERLEQNPDDIIQMTLEGSDGRSFSAQCQKVNMPEHFGDLVLVNISEITDLVSLQGRQKELTSLFDKQSVPSVVWKLGDTTTLAYMNTAYFEMQKEVLSGDTIQAMQGLPFEQVFKPEYRASALQSFERVDDLMRQHVATSLTLPKEPQHGGRQYQLDFSRVMISDDQNELFTVFNFLDVTEREYERQFAQTLLNRITSIVLTQNQSWQIMSCSDAWEEQFGYTREETIGRDLHEFLHPLEIERALDERRSEQGRGGDRFEKTTISFVTKEGDERLMEVSTFVDRTNEDNLYIVTLNDVTEIERARAELEHKLMYDDLTGVLSRRGINKRVEMGLHTDQAVFLIDLDHFKSVNDGYGHEAGDRLLQNVGRTISDLTTAGGIAGRLGGEEFLVMKSFESWDETERFANQIRTMIAGAEIKTEQGPLSRTASIGVARLPKDGTLSEALAVADAALDDSKQTGRNRATLATPSYIDFSTSEGRFVTERDIHDALLNEEMYYVVQPIVDTHQNTIKGFEALIRWKRQDGTMISPETFSPKLSEAAKNPAIRDLKWQMRRRFLQQLSYFDDRYVSFNHRVEELSHPNSSELLIQAFEEIRDTPNRVFVIELSERALTERVVIEDVIVQLENLRANGILIALDDFGVEASNLNRLAQLPIDIIKLDKSLIQRIEADNKTLEVVRSTAIMAEKLGIKTIAEGIETEGQGRMLHHMNAVQQQGYLHARPMPVDQVYQRLMDIGYDLREVHQPAHTQFVAE